MFHWNIRNRNKDGLILTNLLILRDTHDLHGFQGLCEQVLVLLSGNCDIPVRKEAVVVVIFQKKLIWEERWSE